MIEKLKSMLEVVIEIFFSNNVHIIRKHKNNLRSILKECRCNRNKIDSGLEDKINMLLHKYDIKREGFWW